MFPKLFLTDLDGTSLDGGYQPCARFPDSFSDICMTMDVKMLSISPEDVVIASDETANMAMMQPDLANFALCPENWRL